MRLPPLLAALAALALAACGSGGPQNRPLLIGSFPASGATVPTGLTSIRLDYDEPVAVFLIDKVTYRLDGVAIGVFVTQRADEPQSLRIEAAPGRVLGPGAVRLEIFPGLVLNGERHYALHEEVVEFTVSGTPSFFAGSPAANAVTEVDATTFTALATTATPGGRDPVAVTAVRHGASTRVFTQLASGGGTGRALAVFAPGAAAMTEVPLTPSPGSDLTAARPALVLAPDGDAVYAAFRDTLTQRVRVHRVRVTDAVETGVLDLSPAAGASTAPTGLALRGDGLTLLVACDEGAGGRLCYVDLPSFTEVDREGANPGLQGVALGGPGGPVDVLADTLCLAPPGLATADMRFVVLGGDPVSVDPSMQAGASTSVFATFDSAFVVAGLAPPAAPPDLLCVRALLDLNVDSPVAVSDLVGAVPQGATSVRALAPVPGQTSFYALLDANVLARFSWSSAGIVQDDLDAGAAGVQGVSLSAVAPGATSLGTVEGAFP